MGVVSRKIKEGKAKDFSKALPVVLFLMFGFMVFGCIHIAIVSHQTKILVQERRTLASYDSYTMLGNATYKEENPIYSISCTVREDILQQVKGILVSNGASSSSIEQTSTFVRDGQTYVGIRAALINKAVLESCLAILKDQVTDLDYSLERPNKEQSEVNALKLAYDDAVVQANEILYLSGAKNFIQGDYECRSLTYDKRTGETTAFVAVTFHQKNEE